MLLIFLKISPQSGLQKRNLLPLLPFCLLLPGVIPGASSSSSAAALARLSPPWSRPHCIVDFGEPSSSLSLPVPERYPSQRHPRPKESSCLILAVVIAACLLVLVVAHHPPHSPCHCPPLPALSSLPLPAAAATSSSLLSPSATCLFILTVACRCRPHNPCCRQDCPTHQS